MSAADDLARMVPGFDFLQNLMKGAGAALPGVQGFGPWVTPTLDPEELDKRIQELKTVQFWLEQNARLLSTTVQALEVQRMTLNTLKTMNLPVADLREALKARPAAVAPEPKPDLDPPPAAPPAAAPAIDPMQWWGALTQQFTEIAAQAVKDSTGVKAAAPRQRAAAKKAAPTKKARAGSTARRKA